MSFCCSLSGEAPNEPVVSLKTGRVYDKRLLQKYLDENGTEPQSDHTLSDEDIISVNVDPPAVKPRPPTLTSIPALLSTFQNEWDALVLETFTLKQQYQQVRQELSQALYQNDAACRVIARITKERDEAREILATLQAQTNALESKYERESEKATAVEDGMDVDDAKPHADTSANGNIIPEEAYYIKAAETAKVLSKARMKREVPAGLVSADSWTTAKEVETVESLHTSTKPGIISLDLDRSGNLALTGGMDNHAEIYSRERDQTLATLKGHTKRVTTAIWIGGGGLDQRIITGSLDKSIRIWSPKANNSEEGKDVRSIGWTKEKIIKEHNAEIAGIAIHPSGEYFASAAVDGTWAIHTMAGDTIIKDAIDSPISQVAFHPDGMFLGVGTGDGYAKVLDIKQRQVLATLDVSSTNENATRVNGLHFSENGYYFVTTSPVEAAIWDLRKQKKTKSWQLSDIQSKDGQPLPEGTQFTAARFDNSGKYIALAAGAINVFKVKGWNQLATLPAGEFPINAISWSGENSAAIVAATMDNTLHYYAPANL
ncbi:Prp19-domain-containing protein [Coemansia reversa NRRL 1564]|uniref:Pre-mRNA-processing factor 19 n=1 Tax=Coemansia reversa (strain ATCC 12441 / NRRL 1564) TaxID=763665 RepID=A0A2G5BBP7_COERN|nr:Prp19-domain-containing protein [Coemansia reversa NRRL 1564]|eukprot:PIA16439.1 Prp19-domain-containing protein [Coemansia reversa NRRL 1564]